MSQTIIESNYSKVTKVLTLVFGWDADKVYTYENVPAKIWNGFQKADSKGKFFHAQIRSKYVGIGEYR